MTRAATKRLACALERACADCQTAKKAFFDIRLCLKHVILLLLVGGNRNRQNSDCHCLSFLTSLTHFIWVWVKLKPPAKPQVLVHVSIYQDSVLGTYWDGQQQLLGVVGSTSLLVRFGEETEYARQRPGRRRVRGGFLQPKLFGQSTSTDLSGDIFKLPGGGFDSQLGFWNEDSRTLCCPKILTWLGLWMPRAASVLASILACLQDIWVWIFSRKGFGVKAEGTLPFWCLPILTFCCGIKPTWGFREAERLLPRGARGFASSGHASERQVCICVCLLVCLLACLLVCLFTCWLVRLSVCLSAFLPGCLPACLSVFVCFCFSLRLCLCSFEVGLKGHQWETHRFWFSYSRRNTPTHPHKPHTGNLDDRTMLLVLDCCKHGSLLEKQFWRHLARSNSSVDDRPSAARPCAGIHQLGHQATQHIDMLK